MHLRYYHKSSKYKSTLSKYKSTLNFCGSSAVQVLKFTKYTQRRNTPAHHATSVWGLKLLVYEAFCRRHHTMPHIPACGRRRRRLPTLVLALLVQIYLCYKYKSTTADANRAARAAADAAAAAAAELHE